MKNLVLVLFVFLMVTSLSAFSGHITANATWSDDIIITGDTWIDEGVTLTINAGVTVSFPKVDANADEIGDVDFIINGRLLTQGTPENKVIFTSLEDDPQPDDWGGIDYLHVLSQNSNLQYTDVLFAHQGIHINGKLFTLNHGIIQECGDYGIRVENSFGETTALNNVTIFENVSYGLKVESSGIVNGTAVLVSSNGSHGFWMNGTTNAVFTNSRSVSNAGNGVYIVNSTPSFSNTFITSNEMNGVKVDGVSSNPVFNYCSVENNDEYGFFVQDGCTGLVEYTNITGNMEFGIFIAGNSLPIFNYCNIFDNCSESVTITEDIPSNQLNLNNSTGYSPFYTIMFPVNKIDQLHVSGYGNHDGSSDDYYFKVYDSNSEIIYAYTNQNSSYDTNFNLWSNITSTSTSQQLRAYLEVYSIYSYWGRVLQVKYDPIQAQLLTGNSTGVINAGLNWWGQITGVDGLIVQSFPGTVNYETMQTDYIATAGASYTNIEPQFTLVTPDSMLVNPTDATLNWIDMDIDDDALISLYYDDGLDETGSLIVEGISEDNASDSYLWDFAGVPYALYNVYGVIDDGVNPPITSYADGQIMVGPVSVSAPDNSHGAASEQVVIPINVANTYDYFEIISFQFILNFDNLLLTANSVESNGTLTDTWTVDSNITIPGQITVNGFSTEMLSEGGILCNLVFDVDAGGLDYDNCIINISSFEFNDGDVDLVIEDGLFTVLNEYTISGDIEYYSNAEPVEAAYLILSGTEEDSTNTSISGAYSFPDHIAGNYELTPTSLQEIPPLVVTPYDASLVARYALGLETFTNDQIVAGDVNNNLETTVYDAALIAQYSIGLIDYFDAGIWKFTPNVYAFELTGINQIVDFDAIAIGDPSGNWGTTADNFNENIMLEIVSTQRDDEDILILNAYFSEPFISTYTKINFSSDVLQFSQLIESETIANFQVNWQEDDNAIILGAYGVDYVQTNDLAFSLEFDVLDDYSNVNDVIDCEFLLFDEQEGNMVINTESHSIITPLKFDLKQNYPNPFNPETNISFSLPTEIDTKIEIYNVKGQRVQVLLNETLEQGTHNIVWKADEFASGVYFYRIEAGDFSDTKKMILMK